MPNLKHPIQKCPKQNAKSKRLKPSKTPSNDHTLTKTHFFLRLSPNIALYLSKSSYNYLSNEKSQVLTYM